MSILSLLSASLVFLSLANRIAGEDKNSHTVIETSWGPPVLSKSNITYNLEAYQCDQRYKPTSSPSHRQGDVIRICIKPDDKVTSDGLFLRDLDSVYYQKEEWIQYAIEEGQPDFFGFSDFDCYPERQLCWVETLLWAEFFDTEGFVEMIGIGSLRSGDETTTAAEWGRFSVGFPVTGYEETRPWLKDSKARIISVQAIALFVFSFSCVAFVWVLRSWWISKSNNNNNNGVSNTVAGNSNDRDLPSKHCVEIPRGNETLLDRGKKKLSEHRDRIKKWVVNSDGDDDDDDDGEGDLLERGKRTASRNDGIREKNNKESSKELPSNEPLLLDRGTKKHQQRRKHKSRSRERSRGKSASDPKRREALLKRGKKSISTRQFGRKDSGEAPSIPKRERTKKKRSPAKYAGSEGLVERVNNNSDRTGLTMAMTTEKSNRSCHSSPLPERRKEKRGRRRGRRNCIVLVSDVDSDVSSLYSNNVHSCCSSLPQKRRKKRPENSRRKKSRRNCIVFVKDTDSVVSSLY